MATLLIFAGLPGSGKSTIAAAVAAQLQYAWLRIDTIEQALRDLAGLNVEGEGYRLAYRIARDNLRSGIGVVADSCNPITLTRNEWEQVAVDAGVPFQNVEVVCSDAGEHRARVESRRVDVPGLRLPTWEAVQARTYDPWDRDRIVIDTAGRAAEDCIRELLADLGG